MLSAAQGQWPVQRVCFCSQNLIQRHKSLGAIPLEAKCFEENPPNCSIHAFKIQGLKNTNKKLCFKPEASQIRTFTKTHAHLSLCGFTEVQSAGIVTHTM
uniref:Chemokine interleukin-8-like domain-containing protein n=1 Tax=Knipowitschia caucasica TaxID=637954 RepID=A0AAV2JEZ2_KNICA